MRNASRDCCGLAFLCKRGSLLIVVRSYFPLTCQRVDGVVAERRDSLKGGGGGRKHSVDSRRDDRGRRVVDESIVTTNPTKELRSKLMDAECSHYTLPPRL